MEEKLLKEKELRELLSKLSKLKGHLITTPLNDGSTIVGVCLGSGDLPTLFFQESFHCYEADTTKCNLSVLRGFFALPVIEDKLAG